jgi:dihydrofolate reductase
MATIRGMMACTLDGFAADDQGGTGFLTPFEAVDWGWQDFFAQIGTVVMGRKTYNHILTLTADWPYAGADAIVLGQIDAPLRGPVQVWREGLPALIAHLRAIPGRDAWVVGGPMLQSAFIAEGALDRLELCVVPHLLGQGLRVFPDGPAPARQPRLHGQRSLPLGLMMLDYRFGDEGLGGRDR